MTNHSRLRTVVAALRRHRAPSAAIAGGLLAAGALLGTPPTVDPDTQPIAVPVPMPVYAIESVSGTHTASLLNLPLGQPGVFQAPIPVDIDGDLLPDVTAALNLVNAEGALQNPPVLGLVLAPNIEIKRLITAPILGQPAKPLNIKVRLTLVDLQGGPQTTIRFGYDTGLGGSIPNDFKATLGGLQQLFNPLSATIDTTGGYVGLDPGLHDIGLAPVSSSYEGPLTIVGGVVRGPLNVDAKLEYSPIPDEVRITYGTDDAGGQHFTYAHDTLDEVDLLTDVKLVNGATTTNLRARVDRLPRQMAFDLLTTDDGRGSIDYTANADGRAPDVGVDLAVDTPGEAPMRANIDIEDLPRAMSADWEAPQDGPLRAEFDSSGQGIGAIEASIATYAGAPTSFTPFIPSRDQYLNAQGTVGSGPFDELLISGRLERIRHAELVQAADGGFAAGLDVGDGAEPLEANLDLDLRANGLPKLDAYATIAPLPDELDLELDPAGSDQLADPLRITYDASEPIDVDLTADLVLPDAAPGATCGDPDTICATLDARNVPSHLEARVTDLDGETRIDVDAVPRPGGAPADLRATVVLGAPDDSNPFLAAPISAEAEVLGIPPAMRVRAIQNDQDQLESFEFHACDRDYGTNTCSPSTVGDTIGSVAFGARNFVEADRPSDMPPASPLTPLYATVSARGLPTTDELVLFEASGRFTDIGRIQFSNVADVFGVSTDIGAGQDFTTLVDVQDVDIPDVDGGRLDIVGEIALRPLPQLIDLCVGGSGRPLGGVPQSDTTAPCEDADPFGDGSVDVAPLALALVASEDLDLAADLRFDTEGDAGDPTDDTHIGAQAELRNIPAELTALVQSPEEGAEGPLRILTKAPSASDFDVDVAAQFTNGGADCDDPEATGGDISCIEAAIDDLPTHMSAYADTSVPGEANIQFYACDYDFADEDCNPGTAGEIGAITASARIKTGDPDELPVRQPTMAQHLVLLADQEIDEDDSDPDRDLQAQLALKEIRSVAIHQSPDGFDGRTDLGDNVTPLEAVAYLDTRNDDDTEGALVDANATVTPLPQVLEFSQHGPGEDQSLEPLVLTYDSSAAVDVVIDAEFYPALGGDECGDVLTVCAHVEIDDIPEHVRAEVSKVNGDLDGDRRPSSTAVDLELVPDNPLDPKVDLRANGVIGPDLETPLSPPMYLEAELVGAPRYAAVRMETEETLVPGVDGLEVDSAAVQRFEFVGCRLLNDGSCDPGTSGEVDELTVAARTFALRPNEFPPPPTGVAPLYASITQRPGELMEAAVRITDIEEVRYYNRDGLTGVRSISGANQDLNVHVDIQGLPLAPEGESIELGDLELDEPSLDLLADVDVTPLPGELDVCIRQSGVSPVPPATALPYTQPCEDALPFGPSVPLDHTPLSVAYRANTTFDTELHADATITGIDHETGDPADPHRFTADVETTDLPEELTVHVLSPVEREVATTSGVELRTEGPLRALIDAPNASGTGPTIDFAAAYLIGEDAVCKDARATVSVTCAAGRLVNLPTRTEVFYDPTVDPFDVNGPGDDNLIVSTDGSGVTDFQDLQLSSVSPERDDDGERTGFADVLVVDADLLGLPKPLEIRGKIDLPEDPTQPPAVLFEVQDGKEIDQVNATVQNFIAPDPTLGIVIPDRPVGATSAPPDEHITFLQRGEAFKLDALIRKLRGASFRTTRSTTNESMGTQVVSLDFGDDQTIRAFADLQADATGRTIADVLIEEMAAGVDVCFRGAYTDDQQALSPDDPDVFCDSDAVADDEGAFELHSTPLGLGAMDIDAFLRIVSGGGSTILSARADIENIPEVVRGRFPSGGGETEIAAFKTVGSGLEPDGIDQIVFQAASFDIADADTGYVLGLPYQPGPTPGGVFPAKAPPVNGRQYLHVALSGPNFHARGQIGKNNSDPSSQLQRVLLSPNPCAAPEAAPGDPSPPDYPHFPADAGATDYTCVRADFDSDDEDPLELDVVIDGAEQIRLHDAGITDVPDYLQATLASTDPWLHPTLERGWRRPCGTAAVEPDSAIDCMAPLLRLDQPTADSEIYGVLDFGTPSNITQLVAANPALQLADLDALPETGWGDWGADPEGIRVQVGTFAAPTPADPAATATAIRAGIRLDIPRSLTLDQIQTYRSDPDLYVTGPVPNASPPEIAPLSGQAANDIRFRYAVRDGNGNPVNSIGELTGMIQDFVEQKQILISAPCAQAIADGNVTDRPLTCTEYGRGMPIPGELGLQMYVRKDAEQFVRASDDILRNSTFIHLDGRASASVNAGIRMVPAAGPGSSSEGVGLLEASVRNTPTGTAGPGTNPLEPSFRLRAELVTDKDVSPPGAVTFFPAISNTNVKINTVFADFNFGPTAGSPARRVDALIQLNGKTKVTAEIKGYSTVDGMTPANFSADAGVDIDPLNLELQSELSFNFSVRDILQQKLNDLGWFGDIVADIIGGVADAILSGLAAILNKFPLIIRLEAGLLAQFQIDELNTFTLNLNLLHAKVNTNGPGSATIGHMNMDTRQFRAGFVFKDTIHVPFPLDIITGGDINIEIPLLTIEYFPGLLPPGPLQTALSFNTLIDFRNCSSFDIINPFPLTNVNTIEIDGGTSENFIIFPLSDPRFQLSALFFPLPIADIVIDLIGGPIFCAFDPTPVGTMSIDSLHPGIGTSFPDHPLPGLGILPSNPVPSNDPPPATPPPPPPPGPPPPLPVPDGPDPIFSGPVQTISTNQALCGTHTFSALTVNATVTVATSVDNSNPYGTGPACPLGQEGRLTLEANNIVVNGAVLADGIVTANPFLTAPPDPASGTGGGGHGGAGGDGTTPAGGDAYGNATEDPSTFGGSPGSGPDAGFGGGVIRLVGDDAVIVNGTISANGTAGGDDGAPGACDSDLYDGGNPNAPDFDPPADPPYEHSGPTGSGGGSGGGIVFVGTRVDLDGATISARGGNGGPGLLGAGGGGGGGVVKVNAPIQVGINPEIDAGLPGDTSGLCAGIAAPTVAGDGLLAQVQEPYSEIRPFGQFWYPAGAGAPSSSFHGYVDAAAQEGDDNGVTIVTCAVAKPIAIGPPNANSLRPLFNLPTNDPTIANPCGTGGPATVVLGSERKFDDEFTPPDPDALLALSPPAVDQYLGIYSVAVRPTTANNDCFDPGDAGFVNDALDCFVEELPAQVDAVVGIDATRPTIDILTPTPASIQQDTVVLDLDADDQPTLSGLRYLECRTSPNAAFTPCYPNTPAFQLLLEGNNTIDVRAYDNAGNVSLVDSVTMNLDRFAPTAVATISPPDGSNGWHQTPPVITLNGHSDALTPAANPYHYRFDNGAEFSCAGPSLTCVVPSVTTAQLLPGGHQFHFAAEDAAGNRLYDDDDVTTESPMQRPSPSEDFDFHYDPFPPQVALAFVPADDRTYLGDDWFDTRPFVAAGAIDQVGASGVGQVNHDFGDGLGARDVDDVELDLDDGNGFVLYDPFDPPRLPDGTHTVCVRATDVAGNTVTDCEDVRIDSTAPTGTILVNGNAVPAPTGLAGWFVTTPAVTFAGYTDVPGVGASVNRFRFRVDNGGYVNCDPACAASPSSFGTGEHLVHLAARDRFDNVSVEQTTALKVDLSDPSTITVVAPAPPAGLNGWHLKEPYVRLYAEDEGSGVADIRYAIDGGPTVVYSSPFRISRGDHDLCVWAVDVAGRSSDPVCSDIDADLDRPTVTIGAPVPGGSAGWYVAPTSVTFTASDAVGDSGVSPVFDPVLTDLCDHRPTPEDPKAPSGTCVSVDGRPFTPSVGAVAIGEGIHTVRAYAVDVAGRRGPITTRVLRVDLSNPVTTARFVPPQPARGPWYRTIPEVHLTAIDGDQASGVAAVQQAVGANPFSAYTGPFPIGQSITTLNHRAFDASGRLGGAPAAQPVRVDLTPPVTVAGQPSPAIFVRSTLLSGLLGPLVGPQSTQLGWTITENLATTVKVGVIIYDLTGNVVRRLDGGTVTVSPGVPKVGSTTWDGKDYTLLNLLPVGLYYYRVVATDEAGNMAQSGESRPVTVRAQVCLPLVGCI